MNAGQTTPGSHVEGGTHSRRPAMTLGALSPIMRLLGTGSQQNAAIGAGEAP
jgi:hypothetical protein